MDFLKPRYTPMNRRRRIYEGKAKVLYEGPEPGTLIQHFKDDATAFNAKKHEVIDGKGVLNNRISEFVFQNLNDIGVPTHFIRRLNMREQLIREVEIIPLEVVVRNVAAGSLATRLGLEEGTQLPRSIIEFYYKNDQLNDPMVSEEHITAFGWAKPQEIDDLLEGVGCSSEGERRFRALAQAFFQAASDPEETWLELDPLSDPIERAETPAPA